MSTATSGATDALRTTRYWRLLRAYPESYRAAHGAVLLGTMLNAAEAQGRTRPTLSESIDLVRQGLAVRATTALPAALRGRIASAAVGAGLGITAAYFGAYSWVRSDFYSGTVTAGLVWFLPAWLLITIAALSDRLVLRAIAFVITAAVLVAVPLLQPGPFFTVPWEQGVRLPSGPTLDDGTGPAGFAIVTPGQVISPSAATVTLLMFLAALTLIGRPEPRRIRRTALVSALTAGIVCSLAVWAVPWPANFNDRTIWFWPNTDLVLGSPVAFSPPAAVLIAVLTVAALLTRHRNRNVSALAAICALALLASTIALNLAGPTSIGL